MSLLRRTRTDVPQELLARPWVSAPWAVLDLETTGLDAYADSIISVGVVPIDDAAADVAASYYSLVRPETELRPASIEVHGIRLTDLLEAPTCDVIARDLAAAVGDRLLVVHTSWVETGFLLALEAHSGIALPKPLVDTAAMCRRAGVVGGRPGDEPSLELVARKLGLPVYAPHHALGDALTTAVVFQALAHRLSSRHRGRTATVADVLRAAS